MRTCMLAANHVLGDQFAHTVHFYDLNIAGVSRQCVT